MSDERISDMGWDDFDYKTEEVSEEDDDMGGSYNPVPVGLYLCKVVESKAVVNNTMNAYSCIAINLKYEINKCLEINAKPVEGDEGEEWEGRHITDIVNLYNEKEKEGMAKRRKYVALRLGIIKPGQLLRKDTWRDDVVGKQVIIRLIQKDDYKDKKTGGMRTPWPQVGFFDGYEYADKSGQAATEEKWDDI